MFLQTGKCQMNHTDMFVSEGPQSEGNNMPIYDNPTVHNRENSFNNHLLRAQWAAAPVSAQQPTLLMALISETPLANFSSPQH